MLTEDDSQQKFSKDKSFIRNQQNQQSKTKMSKHSNVQSQNIQASLSHRNQPQPHQLAHSENPHIVHQLPQKEWIATYLDGQYFLTDPESISKLKNIEAEIEIQRNRLAKLDQENISNNNSFLSYQEDLIDKRSNKSFCNTEFNQSRHLDRQEIVKNDLEREEELYRQKLKNMERQKIELKKNMKLIDKKQSEKQEGEKKIASSRKQSVNKEGKEEEIVAGSPSKKMSKRASEEEKEKSYHKSRIQKSIKDNLVLDEEIKSQSPEKSAKMASQKVNSIKPVTLKESQKYEVVVLQPPKEETNEQVVEADMRKKEEVNSVHSQIKPKSIIDKQSKQGSVKASQKLSEVPSPSKKSKAVSIFNEVPIENKSIAKESNKNELNPNKEEASIKKSSHNEPILDHKSQRSHARSNAPLLNVETKEANDIQSVKKSQRSVQKSVKVSQKPYQQLNNSEIQSPSRKSKASSIVHESISKNVLINDQQSHKNSALKEQINDHTSEKVVAVHKEEKLLGAEFIENRSEIKQKSISQHSKPASVKGSEKKSERFNESQIPSPSRKSKAASIINEASMKKSTPIEYQIDQKSQKSGVKSHVPSMHSNNKVEVSDVQSEKKVEAAVQPLKESSIKGSEKISEHFNKSQSRSPSRRSKASSVVNEIIVTKEVQINDQQSNKGSVKESSKSVKIQLLQNQQIAKMETSNISINMKKKEESFVYSKQESVKGSIKGSQFEKVNNSEVSPSQVSKRASIHNQEQSEKNSSYIINNEASMNESSHLKLEMLNNELQPSVQDAAPQINMKKKEQFYDNQSEKKSKSFVIHSKQGSVKERSQKHGDNLHNSKASSKSKGYSIMNESSVADNQSVTKDEILKLHQQIALLQLKLQKVEEKQEQMERFEGTLSKIQQAEVQEIVPKMTQSPVLQEPRAQTPIIFDNLPEVSIPSKIQPRLQIESSILQVNTIEEMKKKLEKESEHNEKSKLKDEISRLKKIIRDMQIQKIKSIDHEGEPISPLLRQTNQRPFDGRDSREIDRQSRMEMESINSFKGATQRRFFGSTNKRLLEDAGKIVHNNSNVIDRGVQTPRRRSIQKLKFMGNEDDVVQDQIELPNESNNKKTKNKFYSEVRKSELVGRIGDKEKDFHNFIESSRVIAEESGNKSEGIEQSNAPLKNFSKISVIQDVNPHLSKINYSRMVQEMKKNNPEEQEILPEIHMRDIKMPNLPPCPNTNMTQQELLNLAKATYLVFGINVDQQDKQLCVKKYKNCVIFTLNNQHHECILWHFSGKFYMGGWRTGEPGEGEKDGEGLEFIPDKHVYKGQFLNGKKNGTGILKLTNGNIYDGQWIEGVKNGRGVYLDSATKVIYSGEWRDGKKQGQGYLKLSEKEYYYGTFVKSIKEGFGVEVFVNGDKYKGEYKNGKFHGKGKYIWANGSCYEGQFHQGVRHGQGSWKSAKVNGDIYIGTYDTDKKNGYGRYVWANGCMYQGGFSNDVKHGKGRLTYQDGKEIKGVWEEGNLMSTQSDKKAVQHQDQPLRRSVKVSIFGYPTSTKRI